MLQLGQSKVLSDTTDTKYKTESMLTMPSILSCGGNKNLTYHFSIIIDTISITDIYLSLFGQYSLDIYLIDARCISSYLRSSLTLNGSEIFFMLFGVFWGNWSVGMTLVIIFKWITIPLPNTGNKPIIPAKIQSTSSTTQLSAITPVSVQATIASNSSPEKVPHPNKRAFLSMLRETKSSLSIWASSSREVRK